MIYLDNNATTAPDPRVIDAIAAEMRRGPSNASSLHRWGQRAAASISGAIASIGRSLGVTFDQPGSSRLILTSGGTEANNMAIFGIRPHSPLLVSAIEHPSLIAAATAAASRGRNVQTIPVHRDGVVDLDILTSLLAGHHDPGAGRGAADSRPVVAVMSANNETGILQPIETIAEICAAAGAHLHVDATQSVGKVPVDLGSLQIGSMAMAAHKFHGPSGVGGLMIAPAVQVEPLIVGGSQQLESRGGTEPVPLVIAMALALKLAVDEMDDAIAGMLAKRNRFESALRSSHRDVVIHGEAVDRLPHTTCVSMVGADRQSMLMAMDMAGVAASSGSACSSGSSPPSHVLLAMQRPKIEIESALRFGVSKFTTDAEIDAAAAKVVDCYRRLRR